MAATHVIVGASLAGAKAAETLRAEGFDGRIVLVGAELERPYERPSLSKQLLRGETEVESAYVHPAGYYDDHDIELRLGARAVDLQPDRRTVVLEGGEQLVYDRLLLATGARPRRLDKPGVHRDGIHVLRELADLAAIRDDLEPGGRAAVVGAGWIGTEVAASLRQLGLEVALVAPGTVPLARVLGDEVGAVYGRLHADHGVALHLGQPVQGFAGGRRVGGVVTDDGRTIEADLVVVGVGVEPRIELATTAGLAIDAGTGGVAVDERLESSVPGIYAAGDVAAARHPRLGRRIRVEHWANALHQGAAAARSMLGADVPYARTPYFFSDQYDLGMEYTGFAERWDRVVFRGDPDGGQFVAFWLDGPRVVAAMNANVWDVIDDLRALVERGTPVDDRLLADVDVPLDAVLTAHG
jgi:3-phenylpropionate/trans-cinnamate dioxygenase ferredoxin reductase subunit